MIGPFNRILVVRGGAIGDFILTLPAIRALRHANPAAQIEILAHKQIAALAENRFYAQRVRSIESAELSRFFVRNGELPSELTTYFSQFDLIVTYLYDPNQIFETNLQRSRARKIVRGPAKIDNSSHATRQLARPVEELGILITDFAPKIFPSKQDRHRAEAFLGGLTPPLIALHPGSGSAQKNWPLQNWIELGNHLLGNFGASLVIISGESDESQTRQLEKIWPDPRVRFAKNLPLTDLAAVLENTIFIGHDSGISHLAAATGARCILLFGPTDPAVWAPLNHNAQIIHAPNDDLRQLDVEFVQSVLDQALI